MWLCPSFGDYVMLLPHKTFVDKWEASLQTFGRIALAAKFQQWPACGMRPDGGMITGRTCGCSISRHH